ncbi:hypothetical protein [Mesorhizobium sp. M0701]|uniref:hypothetical protein n=1 Tax=Mesorhizobium sp. M0701 TaxID=2956989 RepID=UPI00333B4CAC
MPVTSWAITPVTLAVWKKKHKKAARVPGTALVIDKTAYSCTKVRLFPDQREFKVPTMSLADATRFIKALQVDLRVCFSPIPFRGDTAMNERIAVSSAAMAE